MKYWVTTARHILRSAHYRSNPPAAARFVAARWLLGRSQARDAAHLLANAGFDPTDALHDFEAWRDEIVATNVRAGGTGVTSSDGEVLYALVRLLRPQVVVETGIAAGVSSTALSAGLLDNGSGDLLSIDLPVEPPDRSMEDGARYDLPPEQLGWAMPADVVERIEPRRTVVLEDVRTALPRLLRERGEIDLFFHDDLHTPDHQRWQYDLVWQHLRPGGVLASDDVNDGWISFCRETLGDDAAILHLGGLALARKPGSAA